MSNRHEFKKRVESRMTQYRLAELSQAGAAHANPAIEQWELRDLRRTATTIMARLKHPPHVVDKILNHAGGQSGTGRTMNGVARIYNKYEYEDERRNALNDLGRYIEGLIGRVRQTSIAYQPSGAAPMLSLPPP
jgi:hypothetical protein